MDRFQILKDEDPFKDMPHGDGCKYEIMGEKYRGWRISETSLLIDMPENAMNYLLNLKEAIIELHFKQEEKVKYFKVFRLVNKDPYIDKKTKVKRVKGQLEGEVIKKDLHIDGSSYHPGLKMGFTWTKL